jgi:ABC-type transport system involved in cytochrome bd biosynthesis fused ATPase/permease subunit
MDVSLLSAGALSSLILEAIKYIVRNWVMKDLTYDFPPIFYKVSIPFLNALMPFALVFLGLQVTDPILTMTWQGVLKYLVLVVLNSLVSYVTNTVVIRPMKDYQEEYSFYK